MSRGAKDAMFRSLFPEVRAGGYTHIDGTVQFYARINSLLRADAVVCDLGAGRGAALRDDEVAYRRELRLLRGKGARVIGVDPDPVVQYNPGVDDWKLLNPDGTLPFDEESIDMIVADFVFEHVQDPDLFAAEVTRVLKRGGWLCARTPNKLHYVAIIARLVPNRLHVSLVATVQKERKKEDIFSTVYQLNTMRVIRHHFPRDRFVDASYYYSAEPSYLPRIALVWRVAMTCGAYAPRWLKQNLFVFMQKRQ